MKYKILYSFFPFLIFLFYVYEFRLWCGDFFRVQKVQMLSQQSRPYFSLYCFSTFQDFSVCYHWLLNLREQPVSLLKLLGLVLHIICYYSCLPVMYVMFWFCHLIFGVIMLSHYKFMLAFLLSTFVVINFDMGLFCILFHKLSIADSWVVLVLISCWAQWLLLEEGL